MPANFTTQRPHAVRKSPSRKHNQQRIILDSTTRTRISPGYRFRVATLIAPDCTVRLGTENSRLSQRQFWIGEEATDFRPGRYASTGGCTVSTGHVAKRTIFSATLPSSSRDSPR